VNSLLRPFMYLALLGFLASLTAHLASHMGIAKPFGLDPMPLHMGIFVVFVPAVLVSRRLAPGHWRTNYWKTALRGCPAWMRTGLYVIFGYAFLNFIAVMLGEKTVGGATALRGFSGHWMVFYYGAFAIMYSAIQLARHDPAPRCKNGHVLHTVDKYCHECGARVA
jgi:hypothetical protein